LNVVFEEIEPSYRLTPEFVERQGTPRVPLLHIYLIRLQNLQ